MILFHLSGRGLLGLLATTLLVLGVLALLWALAGPAWSIGLGLVLVLLIRGVLALLTPSNSE
ncbi:MULTISPECIES: hypothetical protein [unclassified Actinopolyspora]|uniref:hypothetical protein n=1 Tax=unclassified Actinopolyspora TaxID=2639451 RepID=UPI0013F60532|nr:MULTISPECIES: hypothetical protein [unclassified Actinopolyspora]NHD16393.1 hypothetical protein [Actinopolyspora sp. BKK2]NHE75744.1 hypothetical protein [Actinopolyspora sp. BKK1]